VLIANEAASRQTWKSCCGAFMTLHEPVRTFLCNLSFRPVMAHASPSGSTHSLPSVALRPACSTYPLRSNSHAPLAATLWRVLRVSPRPRKGACNRRGVIVTLYTAMVARREHALHDEPAPLAHRATLVRSISRVQQPPASLEGGFQGDGDGRHSVNLDPPVDPFSTAHVKEWTPEADAMLVSLAREHGLDWKQVAKKFPGHTEALLERRYTLVAKH
jgi:hypothetical protein